MMNSGGQYSLGSKENVLVKIQIFWCSLNALSSDRSIEVTESPGLRRMPEKGSLLLKNIIDVIAVLLSHMESFPL